jgi:hypothetical protein
MVEPTFLLEPKQPKWLEPLFAGAELSQKPQIQYSASQGERRRLKT